MDYTKLETMFKDLARRFPYAYIDYRWDSEEQRFFPSHAAFQGDEDFEAAEFMRIIYGHYSPEEVGYVSRIADSLEGKVSYKVTIEETAVKIYGLDLPDKREETIVTFDKEGNMYDSKE